MATITKRATSNGKSSYQATIRKQGFSSVSRTFSRKRDAEQWARRVETDIDLGELSQGSLIYTVRDLFQRYRDEKVSQLKSRRCRDRHLEWWEERLGDVKLGRLNRAQVRECLSELAKSSGRTGATINRYRATLQAALSYAVSDLEWLKDNPLKGMPKYAEPRGRIRFLSDPERKALLDACRDHADLYLIVLIALTTGARQSEIMSMKWSDIDFKQRTVRIEATKNDEPRVLPLSDSVLTELDRRPHGIAGADWVFLSKRFGSKRMSFPEQAWQLRMKRADLEDFRFHDLRHTAASYLAQAGVSTRQLADILGHKTLAMVQRYSHLTVDSRRELVDLLDEKVNE